MAGTTRHGAGRLPEPGGHPNPGWFAGVGGSYGVLTGELGYGGAHLSDGGFDTSNGDWYGEVGVGLGSPINPKAGYIACTDLNPINWLIDWWNSGPKGGGGTSMTPGSGAYTSSGGNTPPSYQGGIPTGSKY